MRTPKMTYRWVHLQFLVAVACGLIALPTDTTQAADQPNILLIIADDFGAESMQIYSGHPNISTPNLNGIAENGVQFTNFWSNPTCSPTRASILTGRYGFRTGVLGPEVGKLCVDEYSLANALGEQGYSTACIGKWHLSSPTNGGILNPNLMGFQHYSGSTGGSLGNNYSRWNRVTNGETELVRDYATSVNVDDASAWIDQQAGSPWFMWLAFNAPHGPFHLPPTDLHDRDELPDDQAAIDADPTPYYEAMVEAMDHEIGRLFEEIGEEELANTMIIFIGDNGTPGGTNPGIMNGTKGDLFEGGVWVPCMVSGPCVAGPTGRSDDNFIHAIDLFSTIIEMAGGSPDQLVPEDVTIDSVSFLDYLVDPAAPSKRQRVFTIGANNSNADGKTARNENYKLILRDRGNEFLYRISDDVFEENNLLARGNQLTDEDQANYDLLYQYMEDLLNSHTDVEMEFGTGTYPEEADQRSTIELLTLHFTNASDIALDDIVLTNLGIDAPRDEDIEIPDVLYDVVADDCQLQVTFGELQDGYYSLRVGTKTVYFHQLLGDFNGDGGVSIFDFTVFTSYFGRTVPDTGPAFLDLNADGGISIFDFTIWLEAFGNTINTGEEQTK